MISPHDDGHDERFSTLRITALFGWLKADPLGLAEDLAKAAPELVGVIEVQLEDDEVAISEHLLQVLGSGASHAILVAPSGSSIHHVRHLIVDAVSCLSAKGHRCSFSCSAVVTDVAEFYFALANESNVADELGDLACEGEDRTVAELLVDQIESAELIILRGIELTPPELVDQFRMLLFALNPTAAIESCLVCALDPIGVLLHARHVAAARWHEPAWLEIIDGRRSFAPLAQGVQVITWRSRRPLDPLAFHSLIDRGIHGLLRARGYFWLASRPNLVGFLGVAGVSTVVETCGAWWAATSHDEWPANQREQAVISSVWDPLVGDRSNDLVFFGVDINEDALRTSLEQCEVHDIESVLRGSGSFLDPFSEWGKPSPETSFSLPLIDDWGPPYPVKCN